MKLTKIGDFLKRSKIPIDILDNEEYKRVTIRINHNGVSLRDTETGKKIGTKKQFILKSGQFIVSKIDARYGAFGIAPLEVDNAIITGNFWAYDVDFTKLNIEWFNQFTNSPDFYDLCERASAGITHRKYLNETFFLNYEIMLPSVEEQLIQIEKIKTQKVSFGELTSELTHQIDLIKQMRQAFLREAMQGKLVKSTNTKETGQQLLAKIKAEKAQLITEKKLKKEKELPPITDDEILFEIPEHWAWCRLGDVIELTSGQDLSPHQYSDTINIGLPYITGASNLQKGQIVVNRWTFTPKSIAVSGDLLFTCKGSGIGKMAYLNIEKVHIARQIMSIRSPFILINYIEIILSNNVEDFRLNAKSLIPGIDRPQVFKLLLALPPLHEQEQIVAKLEELMAFCDGLEQSIKESQGYNEQLLQQVLREALQGNKI